MQVRLVVTEGPEAGRMFSFDGADSFLVGRSPKAHLVLDPAADRYISRTHCLIDIRPPRCFLNDLGSTNGTFLNDRRVDRVEIGDGDVIRVGRTRIRVSIAGEIPAVDGASPSELGTRLVATPAGAFAERPWQPPEAAGAWQPPGLGGAVAAPPLQPPPAAGEALPEDLAPATREPELRCWLCQVDLSQVADADGLAGELADAIYLCPDCEGSLVTRRPGRSRFGAYTVLGELGRGGMGVVFKAVHERTRRVCAVKQILPEAASEERAFRLFEREISVQSRVTHRNLVRLLDHGREDGCCFFVVEFLAGGDAWQLVRSVFKGPAPPRLAVRIVAEALGGLQALHDHGFVHRDLKPSNVLLSRPPKEGFGTAKVTDYGLAKSYEDAGNSLFNLTREGEAAGSLMFMPPEQILNYRYVMPPADVYAAGVTLYYLLTERYTVDHPVGGLTGGGTAFAGHARNPIEVLIEDPPIPILERRPDLPQRLAAVVDRAVQKELSQRYQSAADYRRELLAAAAGEDLA